MNATSTAIYVDMYAPSTISVTPAEPGAGAINVTVATAWPYGGDVVVSLSATGGSAATTVDLALRMPAWVAAAAVPITVNGAIWPQPGGPGTFFHLPLSLPASGAATVIAFSLPMALAAWPYTGASQLGDGWQRVAYTYGPILLAGVGGMWNTTVDSLVLVGVDALNPASFLVANSSAPLHFAATGQSPPLSFVPYFEVQGEQFAVYPGYRGG